MMVRNQINNHFYIFLVGFFSCFYNHFLGVYNLTILPYLIIITYIILNFKNLEFTFSQIISILFLTSYFIVINSYNENLSVVLKNFQYWFGVIFFLIFINNYKIPNSIYRYLFLFLCFQLLAEIITINLFLDQINFLRYTYANKFFGFYVRPIGFAGSTSSSITIICAIFCFLKYNINYEFKKYEYFLFILCVLLSLSHTGFIIYLLILVYDMITQEKNNFKILILGFCLIILVLIFQELFTSNVRSPFNHLKEVIGLKILTLKIVLLEMKLSFNHSQDSYSINLFSELFSQNNLNNFSINELKSSSSYFREIPRKEFYSGYEFIISDLEKSKIINPKLIEESFWGSQIYWPMRIVGGDLALASMIEALGIVGFALYSLLIFVFGRNLKNVAFIILIIGSLHYGIIMSLCGQFVMALIIANR